MQIELATILAHVIKAAAASDAVDPIAARFLLSQYAATGREDLATIVGAQLARAIDDHAEAPAVQRADWLLLFADAAMWSEDSRVHEAAAHLLALIDGKAADGIEAALRASATIGNSGRLSSSVDDLERLIARGYEPGDGVAAADQFAVAAALLTAFEITGRVPYAMLADELVQTWQRRGDAHRGLEPACRAAHVLSRLAALHADDEYVKAAIVPPDADYRLGAGQLLDNHASHALDTTRGAALYGLALAHWLGLH